MNCRGRCSAWSLPFFLSLSLDLSISISISRMHIATVMVAFAAPAANDDRDRQALWVLAEAWIFFREELQSLPDLVRQIAALIEEECRSEAMDRKVR